MHTREGCPCKGHPFECYDHPNNCPCNEPDAEIFISVKREAELMNRIAEANNRAAEMELRYDRLTLRFAELEKALRHIEQTSLNDTSAAEKLTEIHDTAEKALGL